MQHAQGSGGAPWYRRTLHGPLRWLGIALTTLLVLWVALVIYRIPAVQEQQKTEEVVARIHAQKLTLADVDGKHLPPPPDPAQVDATVAGVDANGNGIRDDVELAIFAKYPNSARIRAAELQYAMGLQVEMNDVFNPDTWKANAFEEDRGYQCIGLTVSRSDIQAHTQLVSARASEVEHLVFNTTERKRQRDAINKFEVSISLPNNDFCDIESKTLSN